MVYMLKVNVFAINFIGLTGFRKSRQGSAQSVKHKSAIGVIFSWGVTSQTLNKVNYFFYSMR